MKIMSFNYGNIIRNMYECHRAQNGGSFNMFCHHFLTRAHTYGVSKTAKRARSGPYGLLLKPAGFVKKYFPGAAAIRLLAQPTYRNHNTLRISEADYDYVHELMEHLGVCRPHAGTYGIMTGFYLEHRGPSK